jgi:hypothetical protein
MPDKINPNTKFPLPSPNRITVIICYRILFIFHQQLHYNHVAPHHNTYKKQTESLPAANYVKQKLGSNSVRLFIVSYSTLKSSTFFLFMHLYSNYQSIGQNATCSIVHVSHCGRKQLLKQSTVRLKICFGPSKHSTDSFQHSSVYLLFPYESVSVISGFFTTPS